MKAVDKLLKDIEEELSFGTLGRNRDRDRERDRDSDTGSLFEAGDLVAFQNLEFEF